MGKRVLVTGGAGFIGSHLVEALVGQGHTVRVLDSLDPQVHGLGATRLHGVIKDGVEFIAEDVRDRDALLRALGGIETVFHQAAAVGVGQSMYQVRHYSDVNVTGTATLLDILANERHRVEKLIVASSMSIYGEGRYWCPEHGQVKSGVRSNGQLEQRHWEMRCLECGRPAEPRPTDEAKPLKPASIYALTKRDQEEMCLCIGRAYHIPTVALRYFNVYGERQALSNPYTGVVAIFSARILNGTPPLIFEDGLQSRDFVHVTDVVRANLLAMENPAAAYEVFNVATGRPITIRKVADILSALLGFDQPPVITEKYRDGDIRHCYADISKIRSVLGFAPSVRFEDGIRDLVEWVREQSATDGTDSALRELERRGLTSQMQERTEHETIRLRQ